MTIASSGSQASTFSAMKSNRPIRPHVTMNRCGPLMGQSVSALISIGSVAGQTLRRSVVKWDRVLMAVDER